MPSVSPSPAAGLRQGLASGWRGLPLTAQLGLIGLVVTLSWFVVARTAVRRQEGASERALAQLSELRQAEVLATRMAVSVISMQTGMRGYVLTGTEKSLTPYFAGESTFVAERDSLLALTASKLGLRLRVEQFSTAITRWRDSSALPNIARRRSGTLGDFAEGTAGGRALLAGMVSMDRAYAAQDSLAAELRAAIAVADLAARETAEDDARESFTIRAAAVAIFLLLLILMMRIVARSLSGVVLSAEALDRGDYARARALGARPAPNFELAQLAGTFDRLAVSIEHRERQLQDDLEKLKELERLKTDFVSTVSHELRTPLTSMRGALGLMLGGKVGDITGRGRELLQIAMSNTERLIRLINDILDIEKIDAGHVAVRRDRLRLRPLLDTTLAGLEGLARDAKVRLELEPGVDAEVIGDADRLVQVFTNLVSNAVKFSPVDHPVRVTLERSGEELTVRVRDHGPGIPEAFVTRIFGRFQQAGGAESRRSGGTGLGLAIAKGIVELHDGVIGFEPGPENGTVFWVRLPTAPSVLPSSDARLAVLVVEDDASMRDILVELIDPIARAVPAQSAESALDVLERETIQAVVLDPGLPGMDGFSLARILRADERYRALPIFIFSAREFPPEVLREAGIRATDAFVKTRDDEAVLFERLRERLCLKG